jgi:hypothetical protein
MYDFATFIYYFGAWAFATSIGAAVLAAVDLIENGGKK